MEYDDVKTIDRQLDGIASELSPQEYEKIRSRVEIIQEIIDHYRSEW